MEIKTTQKGFLEKSEIEEIVINYLESKMLNISTLDFVIVQGTAPNDIFAQYPSVPILKGIKFETK